MLFDKSGKEILTFQPQPKVRPEALPPVVESPPLPTSIKTIEELFLTGQRITQFNDPTVDPLPYMKKALSRDPSDSRVNTWMGNYCMKRGMIDEAANYFRKAIRRISHDYTRPANCEAFYGLGLALKNQGKYPEAIDTLYRTTWDYAWHDEGESSLNEMGKSGFFAKFGEKQTIQEKQEDAHYLKALGLFGMGEKEKAKAELQVALKLNKSLVWAQELLNQCVKEL